MDSEYESKPVVGVLLDAQHLPSSVLKGEPCMKYQQGNFCPQLGLASRQIPQVLQVHAGELDCIPEALCSLLVILLAS
jgi:hypothetical protein